MRRYKLRMDNEYTRAKRIRRKRFFLSSFISNQNWLWWGILPSQLRNKHKFLFPYVRSLSLSFSLPFMHTKIGRLNNIRMRWMRPSLLLPFCYSHSSRFSLVRLLVRNLLHFLLFLRFSFFLLDVLAFPSIFYINN